MSTGQMVDSDDDQMTRRERSRSPRERGQDDDIDSENWSPESRKIALVVDKIITKRIAPVLRNLNKVVDTSSQTKGSVGQMKRVVMDVRQSTSQIETHLKKVSKSDPKSNLSGFIITKINAGVLKSLMRGLNKQETQVAIFDELLEIGIVSPSDEDAVKAVSGGELSHFKAHVRSLISQDLSAGNSMELPKTEKYLKSHLKEATLDDGILQFITIMALCSAKFENAKPVPLGESDAGNKKRIEENVDNFWNWVNLKFGKYKEGGETFNRKVADIITNCGYQQRKNTGAVRRPT